jgi:PAS domain S-box-containing protein
MIIGLDRRGRIQLFNREAERVTGWGRDEAMGQVFVDWMSPADAGEEDRAAMAHALATVDERSVAFDGFVSSRSRHVRRVRWHVTSAPAVATDEVVRFVFGQDTTDAAALAEKTRQHERLAAVGTLAAGLAHEIRNPLNGAQLHVSYLKRSIERSDANRDLLEAVTVIGDEIRRLAALATEFLEFARPSPLAKIELSVRSLFERSLQVATPQAVAQKIVLRSDLPSQDLALHGDPARLEQALVNLLQNAIEATADGRGSSVTLRARRQPRRVIVEVEDDGPGIAVPDSPIFDAFFTTKPAGTGLGLAITHRIVTDHAGTIDVESRPGRTVFRVGLPVDGLGGRAVEAGGTGDL